MFLTIADLDNNCQSKENIQHTNSSKPSPSELYTMELNNNEPKYFGMVPPVIFQCTYLTTEQRKDSKNYGKIVRKRLSPQAITFYTFIKCIGGRTNKVWMSTENLAEATGLSVGTIVNVKRELMQPMEQLNGKPLIEIHRAKRTFARADDSKGAKEYHVITPTHIWPESNAYMATFNYQKRPEEGIIENDHSLGSDSRREPDQASDSRREPDLPRSSSRREGINNVIDNTVCKTDKAAAPPVCSSKPGNVPFVSSHASVDQIIGMATKADEVEKLRLILMHKFGADENFLRWLFKTYPVNLIIKAGQYFDKKNKERKIDNPIGYIRSALTKGWVS